MAGAGLLWPVADGWCWFVVREKVLLADCCWWLVCSERKKYRWLISRPSVVQSFLLLLLDHKQRNGDRRREWAGRLRACNPILRHHHTTWAARLRPHRPACDLSRFQWTGGEWWCHAPGSKLIEDGGVS
jgi:hypothetical protein